MADVVARSGLRSEDFDAIRILEEAINQHDGLALKLNWDLIRERDPNEVGDFFVHVDHRLVGYASLDGFGGEYELTGMVHPAYRRWGIGRQLLNVARAECRTRGVRNLLLVCEFASDTGKAFVAAQADALRYDFSEYRLELDAGADIPHAPAGPVHLRIARSSDLPALATIRASAFGRPREEASENVTHAFAETGSRLYVAEVEGEVIGTIGVVTDEDGMYLRALAVSPARQGRGYGRAILSGAVALLLAEGYTHLALDVATENRNALSLYLSCGFSESNRYDYYAVDLGASSA